ncbi:cytochrome c oxidase assembly protein ctaG/Cox11 domain-containing protein [Ditylenchus destructor]|uniref:Cytochrome c oxidase assembly protein COX11, mitochondrial n=1 Tax=Ditylenchus destructor TaxID=166010 RepID=A0AAD4R7V2_9BILA|nr:cytochrome c oxidase assembly protein ctaG/Cox11 domain-containing protein [Ditylenchus destructor]
MTGISFAAVPLYRMFCEATGSLGTTQVSEDLERIEKMEKVKNRLIQVSFNSDTASTMKWQFKPQQKEIYVHPGETALVFFTAKNPTNKPIIGISSYNLTPFQAAFYFNKIQCFCFEEQILNPGEEVDLPVFFYIDPDFANDPQVEFMNKLILSYTFFEAKSNMKLPSPFDPTNRPQNLSSILEQAEKLKRSGNIEAKALSNETKPKSERHTKPASANANSPTETLNINS